MEAEAKPDATPPPPPEPRATAPKPPPKLLLPIVVIAATLVGGSIGALVVAPRLVAARAEAARADTTESHAAPEEHASSGESLFRIDNLIVNPAGSQGARFMMVSLAIEVASREGEEFLRSREVMIRDLIVGLLERQTMETLGQPGIRDLLKQAIADTVRALFPTLGPVRALLPQFVVQ
jgi:flagellar FliL protein